MQDVILFFISKLSSEIEPDLFTGKTRNPSKDKSADLYQFNCFDLNCGNVLNRCDGLMFVPRIKKNKRTCF